MLRSSPETPAPEPEPPNPFSADCGEAIVKAFTARSLQGPPELTQNPDLCNTETRGLGTSSSHTAITGPSLNHKPLSVSAECPDTVQRHFCADHGHIEKAKSSLSKSATLSNDPPFCPPTPGTSTSDILSVIRERPCLSSTERIGHFASAPGPQRTRP